jgi:hypothetical protein
LLRCGEEWKMQLIRATLLNWINPQRESAMTRTDVIAARLATLPITAAEQRAALAHVASGEQIARAFQVVAKWLEASPALKPAYQD